MDFEETQKKDEEMLGEQMEREIQAEKEEKIRKNREESIVKEGLVKI